MSNLYLSLSLLVCGFMFSLFWRSNYTAIIKLINLRNWIEKSCARGLFIIMIVTWASVKNFFHDSENF
jgi:hypothetical protein